MVHIGFRTSGGRGEYEVVGSHSGYTASSLEGWSFFMQWPDGIVRDTGLWLDPGESGKPRLRSLLKPEIQIGRIIAPMLMLPDPTRAFKTTPDSAPIAISKKYTITQVGFSPTSDFAEIAERVTFAPSWVEIANQGKTDAIGVEARWNRIVEVIDHASELPDPLRSAVLAYRELIASGTTIGIPLTTAVRNIGRQLAAPPETNFKPDTDPLAEIEALLGIARSEEPSLPPPNELSEDEPAISLRAAHEYRLAKSRGTSGRQFSEAVRAAYNNRCAFCGVKFGGITGIRSGIDAAHILAWSKHDLDVVQNGIALCKLHHWAFDAGIVALLSDADGYYTRFTSLASLLEQAGLQQLGVDGYRIPNELLPVAPEQRPSIQYLGLLYADLGVTFAAD